MKRVLFVADVGVDDPRVWVGGLLALSTLSALLLWRSRAKPAGTTDGAAPTTAVTVVHRNATVHIGSGAGREEEDRRSTAKMGTPRTPASEPRTFGRYHLLRRIDGGGMADIYAAALHGAEGFRRLFVIKRLRPEMARNKTAVAQFIDEAKLGASLVHPNIVPVFDFGKVGDEYFMAQEYILGRDVARLLQRHARTDRAPARREADAVRRARGAGRAGLRAHADRRPGRPLGLVHRDVSPATSW